MIQQYLKEDSDAAARFGTMLTLSQLFELFFGTNLLRHSENVRHRFPRQ